MPNTFEVKPDEVEPDSVLKAANRCEWAAVACLYALPISLVANSYHVFDLNQVLGLPSAWEVGVNVTFLASWLLAAIGLRFRGAELRLEARARTPAQKAGLRKVNIFRRVWASCILVAPFIAILLAPRVVGSGALGLLLMLAFACCLLSHRVGQMVRQVTE